MAKIKISIAEFVYIELEETTIESMDTLDVSPLIDELIRGNEAMAVPVVASVPAMTSEVSNHTPSVVRTTEYGPIESVYKARFGSLRQRGEYADMPREEAAKAKWLEKGGALEELQVALENNGQDEREAESTIADTEKEETEETELY